MNSPPPAPPTLATHTQSQVSEDSPTPTPDPAAQHQQALLLLTQLSSTSQTILDNMNLSTVLQSLASSFKLLMESTRRQAEILKRMTGQGEGPTPLQSWVQTDLVFWCLGDINPALALAYVPRGEYDALKARYDALAATMPSQGSSKRARTARQSTSLREGEKRGRSTGSETQVEDQKASIRKKRSMKLEVGPSFLLSPSST